MPPKRLKKEDCLAGALQTFIYAKTLKGPCLLLGGQRSIFILVCGRPHSLISPHLQYSISRIMLGACDTKA